jgi:HD-GYP domain-containing protein (c-di-GMP phosphodiesterase class II)
MSTFNINLHEAIFSLSNALDLVGVVQIHHGKRVAFMAAECAKLLGWHQQALDNLFQAAILHDCGVSKTTVHANLTQLAWENEGEHCEIGATLLQKTPPLAYLTDYIRYHHTHWRVLEQLDLPLEVKLSTNCIYMVDRVDVLSVKSLATEPNILVNSDSVRAKIAEKRGTWFHPQLVDAFMEVSYSQAFWLSLERDFINGYMSDWIAHDTTKAIDFKDLKSIAQVFSHIVDAKSTFTKEHSDGVAHLARYLGELFALPEHTCDMLEIAGLLHDLGKLRVPDALLEKNAKLTLEEFLIIQRHSFDTYDIIKHIKGLEEIATWAAQHHERVDGSGYPYRNTKKKLSLEARIIAVADVFQALAQNRPYRGALAPEEIFAILQQQVHDGKLDASVVTMVGEHLNDCWKISLLGD